jgi:hypothetical protein
VAGHWSVREVQAADGALLVRARGLPPADERVSFPVAMWVTWAFADGADDAVIDALVRFEDAAVAAMERGGWAVPVAAVTGGAAREWLFYAADAAEFARELRAAAGEEERWTWRAWDDPQWRAGQELAR